MSLVLPFAAPLEFKRSRTAPTAASWSKHMGYPEGTFKQEALAETWGRAPSDASRTRLPASPILDQEAERGHRVLPRAEAHSGRTCDGDAIAPMTVSGSGHTGRRRITCPPRSPRAPGPRSRPAARGRRYRPAGRPASRAQPRHHPALAANAAPSSGAPRSRRTTRAAPARPRAGPLLTSKLTVRSGCSWSNSSPGSRALMWKK